jgi:transposase
MPGWFKGMKTILEERGFLEEANLRAECAGFKCKDQTAACCCRRVFFNQQEFVAQKPALFELVESHGHFAFFYPKFHCELNFIEQCWGYAKLQYRMLPPTKKMRQKWRKMCGNALIVWIYSKCTSECVIYLNEGVLSETALRYANRAARFIDAYKHGLNGIQASWANRKFHGHRVLPKSIIVRTRPLAGYLPVLPYSCLRTRGL